MISYLILIFGTLLVANPFAYKGWIKKFTNQDISYWKALQAILVVGILSTIVFFGALALFGPIIEDVEPTFFMARSVQVIAAYFLFSKVELKKYDLTTKQRLMVVGTIVFLSLCALGMFEMAKSDGFL